MNPTSTDNQVPVLRFTLELAPELASLIASPTSDQIQHGIEREANTLLTTLGIPGQTEVAIALASAPLTGERPFRLFVDGHLCRYSDELLIQAYSYTNSIPLIPLKIPEKLYNWLQPSDSATTDANGTELQVAEFFGIACRETLARQAEVLLGVPQIEHYCKELAALPAVEDSEQQISNDWLSNPNQLIIALRQVVNLGIAIADQQQVADILFTSNAKTADELAEILIATLRPSIIEIRMAPDYLHQVTVNNADRGAELFPFLRDGLFEELGVSYPDFCFVSDAALKPNSFTFTINHLTPIPLVGIASDTILVNDTVDQLQQMNVDATPTQNPVTLQPCAFTNISHKETLENAGITTWDQLIYIIFCFAGVLRKYSNRFIDHKVTAGILDQIELAFPDLRQAASLLIPLDTLTRILRSLLADEISIRNMPRILERLIEYELSGENGSESGNRLTFVRAGLREAICHKLTRGQNTLVTYLLDPKLENELTTHNDLVTDDNEQSSDLVISAIRKEMSFLQPTAAAPAILTYEPTRTILRQKIAQELPQLAVISYTDLPPTQVIQPVARISLD
jgi:hypothetical protein